MTIRLVSDEKIAETSSKGNQEKWRDGGRWYKLDQFGYEALAETLTSLLLEKSNVESDTPFRFVRYQMERLHVHGHDRTGCSSENFLKPGQSIVTLSHLFRQDLGKPLKYVLGRLPSDKKRIAYLAEETAAITGLREFPAYLTLLFEIDALVLNDDRHLNNIAVIEQNGHCQAGKRRVLSGWWSDSRRPGENRRYDLYPAYTDQNNRQGEYRANPDFRSCPR